MFPDRTSTVSAFQHVATRLRIEPVRGTSAAGSGHPSSCCSATDLVAAPVFGHMRFDPRGPQDDDNDRFVLSKGHAAPLLYAAWADAAYVPAYELQRLRRIDCDLEGHPTPRLPFVDVATGSQGQGVCAAVGSALNVRRIASAYRTYLFIGDGESAEGSVWEAAQGAERYRLDKLCTLTDVNGFGQSRATQWGHDMEAYRSRSRAFGWHASVGYGPDIGVVLEALEEAAGTAGQPTMILARTVKGHGVPAIEGKDGWHGKPIPSGDDLDGAISELARRLVPGTPPPVVPSPVRRSAGSVAAGAPPSLGGSVLRARQRCRDAHRLRLGPGCARRCRPARRRARSRREPLDVQPDVRARAPDRFFETYIAEQAMFGAALELASRGAIPFPSTFAALLARASDCLRMAGIGGMNIEIAGSHAGVLIGEDGPSQMALEDLAVMRAIPGCAVHYPRDEVCTERLVAADARDGAVYIRTTRPKTPVIYCSADEFTIRGSKVVREAPDDAATVVAAGVTLFEVLRAHDELAAEGIVVRVIDTYSVQPVVRDTLRAAARETGATR